MFLLEWQEIVQRNLSDFSGKELQHLHELSAVAPKGTTIPTLVLDEQDFSALFRLYQQAEPYILDKLPDSLTRLCIQSDLSSGKVLYYFKRLKEHPNWYILDIFQKGGYQCTFLALDSEPFSELRITSAPFYVPVCLLTSKRESLSNSEAYQAFKFAHFLFQHQTVRRQ